MWIEIFKAGKHKSADGIPNEYSSEDIRKIEMNYNQKSSENESFEAPLVKGHPKDNDPAFGWVEKLARKGDTLLAKIKNPDKSIIDDIRLKKFKKVSVALYPDLMLRHVGLLGAATPAVKGLKPVSFSDNSDFVSFFSEDYDLKTVETEQEREISRLKLQNAKLKEKVNLFEKKSRLKEFKQFSEELNYSGTSLSPAQSNELVDIFEQIYQAAGDNSTDLIGKIKEFVKSFHTENLFSSIDLNRQNTNSKDKIHTKATQIRNEKPELSYEEAVLEAHSYFYK